MSGHHSKNTKTPNREEIFAIDKKFCQSEPVTLKMSAISANNCHIISQSRRIVHFIVKPKQKKKSLKKLNTLTDKNGKLIATLGERKGYPTEKYIVYDNENEQVLIIRIRTGYNKFQLIADIQSPYGMCDRIVGDGSFPNNAILSIEEDADVRRPIAKISKPFSWLSSNYEVVVAPKVDVAMVALICLALTETHEFFL